MSDRTRSARSAFTLDESAGIDELTAAEAALDLEIARSLERLAAADSGDVEAGFTNRVMAAIAEEPRPAPGVAAVAAARRRRARPFVASLADAWRVAFGGGRPVVARAQALVVVIMTLAVLSGSSVGAAAATGLLADQPSTPPVDRSPAPSPVPTWAPSPHVHVTPSPDPVVSRPATDGPTTSSSEEPRRTDDHGGNSGRGESGGSGGGDPGPGSVGAGRTPLPTTDDAEHDDRGDSGHGGDESDDG
jgi:uncharacterized membrane protein YgcG